MSLSKILLAASVMAAKLECPAGKQIDPDFSLEIMHLQDITEKNQVDIGQIGSLYAYIVDDLVEAFPGKIKYGYAEFSDDASPDGNVKFANYQCLNVKRQPTPVSGGSEVMQEAIKSTPVADYDTYNCGFKAMTLAMNTNPGGMVNWSNSPTSFRILSMNTVGPGKLIFDRLSCPLTTDYQNCPMAWALASFDPTKNGDATNSPTLDDMWEVGDDNKNNMSFISMVKPGPTNSSTLDANQWWATYGIDMLAKEYNINVIDEFNELSKIVYAQALEAACVNKNGPQNKVRAQSSGSYKNTALDNHLKTPKVPVGFRMPAKRAGHR